MVVYFTDCAYITNKTNHNSITPQKREHTNYLAQGKQSFIQYIPSHWLALLVGLYLSFFFFFTCECISFETPINKLEGKIMIIEAFGVVEVDKNECIEGITDKISGTHQ